MIKSIFLAITTFILLLLIVPTTSNAQTNFKPGYILNHNGDTVKGFIDYRADRHLLNKCDLKKMKTQQ